MFKYTAPWQVLCLSMDQGVRKPQIPEDDIKLKEDRDQNSANLSDPATFILTSKQTMEIDVPVSEHKGVTLVTPDDPMDNQTALLSAVTSHNGLKDRHESLDSDVAKEIRYLDEVLEANCCDSSADNTFNGSPSPEPCVITVDGSGPFVGVTNYTLSTGMETISVDRKPLPVLEVNESSEMMEPIKINGHSPGELKEEHGNGFTYPASPNSSTSSRRSSKDGEITLTTIKKEAKFELRAFHEEKKPSKLFEDVNERENFRVRKVRPSEEALELEKERLDLIKNQAVKKNPSIATKWWNPPQEKTIEQQLDAEHLESHMKYKERKQKQQQHGTLPPAIKNNPVPLVPSEPTTVKTEDVVIEQIDFSAARKQFLNMENINPANFKVPPKRPITQNLYSVKPFYKSSHAGKPQSSVTMTNPSILHVQIAEVEADEVPVVKAENINCISNDQQLGIQRCMIEPSAEHSDDENLSGKLSETLADDREFLSARASFTVVKDDENEFSDHFARSVIVNNLPEELDSGLDDLSVKSQDTTVMETLSNDFSMDNISDNSASNETMNALHENSLGDFSQPQTPLNDTPIEFTLEGGSKSFSDQGFYSPSSAMPDSILLDDQLEYHAGILVHSVIQQALAEQAERTGYTKTEDSEECVYFEDHDKLKEQKVVVSTSTPPLSPESEQDAVFELPQVWSPVQEKRGVTLIPEIPKEQDFELWQEKTLEHSPIPPVNDKDSVEEIKQEVSYFSKYSQAAELRSTASILATQEPEITVGPFKLRSKKQRTLSMIEEEIRAAQEREQDLKKQRQSQIMQGPQSPSSKNTPAIPTRTVSYKTAPGKIEKIRTPPSSSPIGECFPVQPDLLLEEAAGCQRPKNLMQTLLDDYETHKSKRRDKMDDSSVLEAVRVNRRKSALALRWEAGIYANREEDE
ncbi:A-kinase anchor protein 2 isoform X3 [Ascaphus truei]|uniref:A-kinase anchor protein 2 isoform X3 n=1 Tax=Ascaphus truei TaxID=8439 RepID=UPI003F5972ED